MATSGPKPKLETYELLKAAALPAIEETKEKVEELMEMYPEMNVSVSAFNLRKAGYIEEGTYYKEIRITQKGLDKIEELKPYFEKQYVQILPNEEPTVEIIAEEKTNEIPNETVLEIVKNALLGRNKEEEVETLRKENEELREQIKQLEDDKRKFKEKIADLFSI